MHQRALFPWACTHVQAGMRTHVLARVQTRGPSAPTCHVCIHAHTHTHARLATELIHSMEPRIEGDPGVQTRTLCRGLGEAGDCSGRRLCVGTAYPILTGPSPSGALPRLQPAVCTWVGFGYSFSHPAPWKNGPIQAACSLTQAACNPLPPRAQGPESLACHSLQCQGSRSQFHHVQEDTGPMSHGPPALWVPHMAECL